MLCDRSLTALVNDHEARIYIDIWSFVIVHVDNTCQNGKPLWTRGGRSSYNDNKCMGGGLICSWDHFFPSKRSPAEDLLGPEAGLEVRTSFSHKVREVEDQKRSSKEDC